MSKPCLPLLTPTDTHTQSASSSTRGIYPLAHSQEKPSYGPEIVGAGLAGHLQAARRAVHWQLAHQPGSTLEDVGILTQNSQKAVKTKPLETGRMCFCSVVVVGFFFKFFFSTPLLLSRIFGRDLNSVRLLQACQHQRQRRCPQGVLSDMELSPLFLQYVLHT